MARQSDIVGVFNPSKTAAKHNSDYVDLAPICKEHNLTLYRFTKISDKETTLLITSLQPDVIFVFGLSQLIPKQLLEMPRLGCIGTHPALLPKNRGRHPLIWALVEGLEESGLTFLYLDEGVDSGDILWQRSFPITLQDDARSLYQKIKSLASDAINEFLPQLANGTAPRVRQDHSKATYWRKRTEKDGEALWNSFTSSQVFNLVRALTKPYVGAHTNLRGQKLLIWRSILMPESEIMSFQKFRPGEVCAVRDDGFVVKTIDGSILITDYEVANQGIVRVGDQLG